MTAPAQTSRTLAKFALVAWIIGGVSVLATAIGIVILSSATNNAAQTNGFLFLVCGGIGIAVGLILGFSFQKQAKAVGAIASGAGEIWARWTCSADDARRFVENERARLTITSRQRAGVLA